MRKGLLFFAFFFAFEFSSFGQQELDVLDKIVRVSYEGIRSDKAVKLLSNELGYGFSYDASLLDKRLIILVSENSSVRELLYDIFDDRSINISVHKQQILVYKNYYSNQKNPCIEEFVLTGKVLDERLLEPVPYSAIKVNYFNQHTVANDDGIFVLKLPCQVDSIEIEIYALGYVKEKHHLAVTNKPLNIFLSPTYIPLQEVIIRSVEPEIVLRKCLEGIQENYTIDPANAVVFFRETIQKNDSLVGLSEAIFDLYKQPYISSKKDKLKLVKGRKYINKTELDTVDFKLKGSLNSCLLLDVVKNLPSFLKTGSTQIYNYKFDDILDYNEKLVYKIDFAPKEGINNHYYQGSLYIDERNYSLVAVEFQIAPSLLHKARSEMVFKKSGRLITKPLSGKYTIHYQEVGDRHFLSYVKMDIQMKVRVRGKLFGAKYKSSVELVINKVETERLEEIARQEVFNPDKIFLEQPIVYDLNFWKGFGFFPLNEPLLHAVHALESLLSEGSE